MEKSSKWLLRRLNLVGRRELNPRPQTLHLKATTCLVSRLFNPIAAN